MLNNLEQSGFRSDFTTRGEWAEADKSECSESRVVLEETIVTSACYNDNTQLHDDQLITQIWLQITLQTYFGDLKVLEKV